MIWEDTNSEFLACPTWITAGCPTSHLIRIGIRRNMFNFLNSSIAHVDLAGRIGVTWTFEVNEHFANEDTPDLLGMAMFHLEKPSLKNKENLKWSNPTNMVRFTLRKSKIMIAKMAVLAKWQWIFSYHSSIKWCSKARTSQDMDGALHTDFAKQEPCHQLQLMGSQIFLSLLQKWLIP